MTGGAIDLPRPDKSVHPVGRDHTGRAAREQRRLLEYFGLHSGSRLLEIGCGIGRLVHEIAPILRTGRYAGFDISPAAIDWLRTNYGPVLPNFAFDLVDVTNARYRPRAGGAAENVVFPYDDRSFDLACSFSVFTHLRLPVIARYLGELRRVLTEDGRGVMTFFAIRPGDDQPSLTRGRVFLPMGDGVWTTDLALPEKAIAYDRSLIEDVVADAGLAIVEEVVGVWHHFPRTGTAPKIHKDVFVLTPMT